MSKTQYVGLWKDGTPYTVNGTDGERTTRYVRFEDEPDTDTPWLEVDLDDLVRHDATSPQLLAHHARIAEKHAESMASYASVDKQLAYETCERVGTRLLARAIELAPTLGIDPQEVGRDREVERLRAVVAAMTPIVDAARAWHEWVNNLEDDSRPTRAHVLDGIIRDNLDCVTAALAGVGVDEEKERMRRLCEAACEWVDRSRRGEPDRRLRDVTAAVDAYRKGSTR